MSITSVGTGEKSGDVRLVSFKSGFGVKPLLKKVKAMANIDGKDKGGSKKDIYVVGGERAERSGAERGRVVTEVKSASDRRERSCVPSIRPTIRPNAAERWGVGGSAPLHNHNPSNFHTSKNLSQ